MKLLPFSPCFLLRNMHESLLKYLPFLGENCLPSLPPSCPLTLQLNEIRSLLLLSPEIALSEVSHYCPSDKPSSRAV